jgi:hypothetical protein
LLVDTALEGLRDAVKYAQAQVFILNLTYRHDAVTLAVQGGGEASRQMRYEDHSGTGMGMRFYVNARPSFAEPWN